MPDVTACVNSECGERSQCFRYRMVWSSRQSVSRFPTEESCPFLIPLRRGDRLLSLEEADLRSPHEYSGTTP
jgi:hypothetical protein